MRVIIAGGRERHVSPKEIDAALSSLKWTVTTLVCGMARGVDACALAWANERRIPVDRFYPPWGDGRRAGPMRNEQMAQNADALLAFPGSGTGTQDMIKRARRRGLRVEVIR